MRRQGRYRYYRLACNEVADALESLVALAATAAPRESMRMFGVESFRVARICYDHMAGKLGAELDRSLVRLG